MIKGKELEGIREKIDSREGIRLVSHLLLDALMKREKELYWG
ncbi:MAG: hypothetical protein N2746_05050 [Deltaproteobacteria bacterium]|nr:hypothetical protein [Deltaproteobacteria bacterium]